MKKLLIILSLCLLSSYLGAQPGNTYNIEGSDIVMYLNRTTTRAEQEKFLEQFGMTGLSLDTLWKFGSLGHLGKEGWKVSLNGKIGYRIFKSLKDLSGNLSWKTDVLVTNEFWEAIRRQTEATFGVNAFRKTSVYPASKGKTRFVLYGHREVRDAYLSGTFNGWSTLSTPMMKTDSGWVADVAIGPGKHCYKFIAGGKWLQDAENLKDEDDLHNGYNSVYFLTNYAFKLSGYGQAKEVMVTGSFNGWNKSEKMKRTANGWNLPVYIKDGIYTYRFLVDGKPLNDPANPNTRAGSSYLELGNKVMFRLDGFPTAKNVILSGTFNNWDANQLAMTKTETGWEFPLVLAPGNYQYKFIVDGQWMTDPRNPHTGNDGNETNSLISQKPNQQFILKGYTSASRVDLSGTFNNWMPYTMAKTADGWKIDLYLPRGKTLYKFVVDGKWILDPDNKLWEQNEHQTGNSVLWVGVE